MPGVRGASFSIRVSQDAQCMPSTHRKASRVPEGGGVATTGASAASTVSPKQRKTSRQPWQQNS
jgi:hypothetical protein